MKKTVVVVLVLYLIQSMILNIGHPITPDYVTGLGIEDYMFGVFFAEMSLGLALGGLFWGMLGDRFNKKNLIVLGLLTYSVGQFVFGNIHNVVLMNVARFVSGFGVSATMTLLLSYLVEKSDSNKKTQNIAYSTALTLLGAGTGYLIGGRLPSLFSGDILYQTEMVFLIQAIFTALFAFVIYFSLENTSTDHEGHSPNMITHIRSIRTLDKNLLLFLFGLTLTSIAMINVTKFAEVLLSRLSGSQGVGDFGFITSIVSIIATVLLIKPIVKLQKDMAVMITINLISAIIVLVVFRLDNMLFGLYSFYMIFIALKALYLPFEIRYISGYAKDGELSKIMGIRQFFFSIGYVIGPLLGGVIFDIFPRYVFDLSAILYLTAFGLIIVIGRRITLHDE